MGSLLLHDFHQSQGAQFLDLNGCEAVANYGDSLAEYTALHRSVIASDLSYRSRLCVLGADRVKFLNGQVTNNVKDLRVSEGCYAALVSAKGKIQSDLHIYILENEVLLEFEAGFSGAVQQRLEKYIIAEDAQVMDVSPHYGLWSVQGPKAAAVLNAMNLKTPEKPNSVVKVEDAALGEMYVVNRVRTAGGGFDLFVPCPAMPVIAASLVSAAGQMNGRLCGWQALETARIEAGIPRFGIDMDETNLASEALGATAISYSKGCYIGQEVLARIRTYGQVAKALRGLRLPDKLDALPLKGDKIFLNDKEVGYITSATNSPRLKTTIALGYVRKECNQPGTKLELQTGAAKIQAGVVEGAF